MASRAALAKQAEKREIKRASLIQAIRGRLERIETRLDALIAESQEPAPAKPSKK